MRRLSRTSLALGLRLAGAVSAAFEEERLACALPVATAISAGATFSSTGGTAPRFASSSGASAAGVEAGAPTGPLMETASS